MKIAIVLFCYISLAFAEELIAFKVSGRNLRCKDAETNSSPNTKVDIKMKYQGYYKGDYVDSASIPYNFNPNWTKEFFFVYPEGTNVTFEARVWEKPQSSTPQLLIGRQDFLATELTEKGVLVKRLDPDNSMEIIFTQTQPTHPTCKVTC